MLLQFEIVPSDVVYMTVLVPPNVTLNAIIKLESQSAVVQSAMPAVPLLLLRANNLLKLLETTFLLARARAFISGSRKTFRKEITLID